MASAAAALKEALLIAVCVMLIHSSMGHKPLPPRVPASKHCPYTGQKPPPPPSPKLQSPPPPVPSPPPPSPPMMLASPPPPPPVPSPPPPSPPPVLASPPPPPVPSTPSPSPLPMVPAPAPASTNCSQSNCAMQCSPICEANRIAAEKKCNSDFVANGNACYASCTSSLCHGDGYSSTVYSGCGGYCPCGSANATMCSQSCQSALYPEYSRCVNSAGRGVEFCVIDCTNSCYKNCTQGA